MICNCKNQIHKQPDLKQLVMQQKDLEDTIGRFMLKIFKPDIIFLMEDSLYIMKRQDHWKQYQEKVGQFRERFKNSMIAGGAFGLALIFSLRRYFPSHFSHFSANRFLIESFILGGSLFGSSISVMLGASKFIHLVKKDYILQADKDIYLHMNYINQKYKIGEQTQVRFALSTEQYQQWKKYRHKMVL